MKKENNRHIKLKLKFHSQLNEMLKGQQSAIATSKQKRGQSDFKIQLNYKTIETEFKCSSKRPKGHKSTK